MYILIQIVGVSFDVFYWMMIGRVILSWISPGVNNKWVDFVVEITDYILVPIKRFIPTSMGGVDFSPILAIFLLSYLKKLLISILYSMM